MKKKRARGNPFSPLSDGEETIWLDGIIWVSGVPAKVRLLRNEGGGSFSYPSPESVTGLISLGLASEEWWMMLSLMIHELLEFNLTSMEKRYHTDANTEGKTSCGALFVLGHDEFADAVTRTASPLAALAKMVYPVWLKEKRKKEKDEKQKEQTNKAGTVPHYLA